MALHEKTHPQAVPGCFGCKLVGLSFGTVPGAYRDSTSNARIDMDALERDLGDAFSEERVRDAQSDATRAIREFNEASA